MISLAFLGPIPWIYCSAITTRLLVGMLTPAMRATVIHSCCRLNRGRRAIVPLEAIANDNATPSPFPGARYRSVARLGCGLLMDSTSFRQPLLAPAFARGSLAAAGAPAGRRRGRFCLYFHWLLGGPCRRLGPFCLAFGRRRGGFAPRFIGC